MARGTDAPGRRIRQLSPYDQRRVLKYARELASKKKGTPEGVVAMKPETLDVVSVMEGGSDELRGLIKERVYDLLIARASASYWTPEGKDAAKFVNALTSEDRWRALAYLRGWAQSRMGRKNPQGLPPGAGPNVIPFRRN